MSAKPATPITVDLHCHPSIKPFSQTYAGKKGVQPDNAFDKQSPWYYDPPSVDQKALDIYAGLPRYRQSNLTSAAKGNVRVLVVSLHPLEQGFIRSQVVGTGVTKNLVNITSRMGKARLHYVLSDKHCYYQETLDEYNYWAQMDGKEVTLQGGAKWKYKIVKNFNDIATLQNPENDNTIAVVLSVESAHMFGSGYAPYDRPADAGRVLENVQNTKNWQHRPLFITFCHHFYNQLSGHALTLPPTVGKLLNQTYGANGGITPLGYNVLDNMLDGQSRILVDIKHMSRRAREQYYQYLDTTYGRGNVPILSSHSAVTGLSFEHPLPHDPRFNPADINLFDEDILAIARSGGVVGIQLDQRRIASKKLVAGSRYSFLNREKMLGKWSRLVWLNMEYMAELLDRNDLPAWDIQSLGSDFDGMINALNGFWCHEQMPDLLRHLRVHAERYLESGRLTNPSNYLSPDEIVEKFAYLNAFRYFQLALDHNSPSRQAVAQGQGVHTASRLSSPPVWEPQAERTQVLSVPDAL